MLPADRSVGRALRRLAIVMLDLARPLIGFFASLLDAARMLHAWRSASVGIGQNPHGRMIIMLVISSLRVDPRVRREAQALAAAGYEVTVIWPDIGDDAGQPIHWGARIHFAPLARSAGDFAYRFPGFLAWSLVRAGREYKPMAFHAHDLNTMLAAAILGRETGAHVVADHHEWFSEHVTWSSARSAYVRQSAFSRHASRWLERFVLRHASQVITVCQSIATEMNAHAPIERQSVAVIRNIPSIAETAAASNDSLRRILNVHEEQLLVLYQGGIGPSRALEPVIEALAYCPQAVLAVRGPSIGDYAEHYRMVARRAGVMDRLHLLQPVSQEEVVSAAYGADCGLYTVADLCMSFRYALPNKVFEYLAAGLPVLTADYPEVRRLLVDGGAGLAFNPEDPHSIADAMKQMARPSNRSRLAAAIPRILQDNRADVEWQKLVLLYNSLSR